MPKHTHKNSSTFSSFKFLDEKEEAQLLTQLSKSKSRDALILLLLHQYGMRSGELLAVRIRDVNLDTGSFLIHGSKNSNAREFTLSQTLHTRMRNYFLEVHNYEDMKSHLDDLVFPLSYNRLGEIWRYWRPGGCTKPLHSLRHTCALRTYERCKDVLLLKTVLGHKALKNTMVYAEFSFSKSKINEALGI